MSQNLANWQRVGLHVSRRRAGSRTSQLTKVHVHVDDVELREDTGVVYVCPSSWTVRLFDVVVSWIRISSSSLWTSPLRDAESRAAKEHRSFLGLTSFRCWSINLVSRSHWSISSFLLLWRPEWWHTGIVTKKKKKLRLSRSLPFFLSTMLLSFLKKKKKKKKDIGRIFQQRGRQIYTRSGKNLLACTLSHPSRSETVKDVLFIRRKESTCEKQESWFNKCRIDVAFSSGCTSRRHFGVVACHPSGGELPFLKGFSLWTDQSERVYFYWPPGPNPVVTISTRVGPGSRLE